VASTAIHVAVAAFAGLILLAMHAYPGGTTWDPTTRGSDFWLNYLCDLERGVALDGEPNPVGATLARVAVVLLALGFVAMFWTLPRLLPGQRGLGNWVRWLGFAGALGSISVGALPNDRFGDVHIFAILSGAVPSLAAASLAVLGLARGHASLRGPALVGAAMVIVSVVDLGAYLVQELAQRPAMVEGAILERCALLLVLVWMILIARALATRAGRAAPVARPPSV
jgi:hypothetical protein